MNILNLSSTFTRPTDTTAYAANDLIANSTTAGSVVPMIFPIGFVTGFKLYRASVASSNATVTNAKYNILFYSSSPTCANGDNGALSTTASGYLGQIAVDSSGVTFTDTSVGWSTLTTFPLLLCARNIYGLLQATAAYTPANAETFTVTLTGETYV